MYFPGFAVTATGLSYDTIEVTWQPLDPELADITSGYSVEWYFQAIPVSTYMTSIGVFLHHIPETPNTPNTCLLYTSDAADE